MTTKQFTPDLKLKAVDYYHNITPTGKKNETNFL